MFWNFFGDAPPDTDCKGFIKGDCPCHEVYDKSRFFLASGAETAAAVTRCRVLLLFLSAVRSTMSLVNG